MYSFPDQMRVRLVSAALIRMRRLALIIPASAVSGCRSTGGGVAPLLESFPLDQANSDPSILTNALLDSNDNGNFGRV